MTLRVLLFFTGIIALFLTKVDFKSEIHKVNKGNKYLFTAIFLTLVYILIFAINRVKGDSYAVAITPMYEYSKLLFIFGFYFARRNTLDTVFLSSLLVFFILQDIYYGGRVTSIQLLFVLGIFVFSEFLTIKKALFGGAIVVIISSFVGSYRASYSLEGLSIFKVFNNMIESLFVFDTATYSYYASATHVAASQIAMTNDKTRSFLDFLSALLLGVNTEYSDVTALVSQFYYINTGGGLIPTHFFFWFGWLGVAFISFFLVTVLNKLVNKKSDYSILLLISILVVSPRWYLYAPNALFRAAILFTTFLYLTLKVSEKITQKTI